MALGKAPSRVAGSWNDCLCWPKAEFHGLFLSSVARPIAGLRGPMFFCSRYAAEILSPQRSSAGPLYILRKNQRFPECLCPGGLPLRGFLFPFFRPAFSGEGPDFVEERSACPDPCFDGGMLFSALPLEAGTLRPGMEDPLPFLLPELAGPVFSGLSLPDPVPFRARRFRPG